MPKTIRLCDQVHDFLENATLSNVIIEGPGTIMLTGHTNFQHCAFTDCDIIAVPPSFASSASFATGRDFTANWVTFRRITILALPHVVERFFAHVPHVSDPLMDKFLPPAGAPEDET